MTPTLQDRAKEALDKIISLEGRTFSLEFEAETLYAGYLHRYFETIREALRLAADPEWVYVPREPTREMIEAACPTINEWIGHPEASEQSKKRWYDSHLEARREQYKTMISAAPVQGGSKNG
jgi:hypothetical protein